MKPALVLAAVMLAVPLAMTVTPEVAFAVQGDHLPGIDVNGTSLALSPEQLTAEERELYAKLQPGSDDARKFLYTRGFLRYCRQVIDGRLEAAALPHLPAKENWDRKFLTEDEAKNTVDAALGRYLVAQMRTDMPPPAELTLLTLEQLDPDERAAFAKLPAGSDAARRFLYTRSFLRPCKQVVDRTLDPARLPDLPREEDWDRRYLTETEGKQIVDVCLGMSMMAMMK